MKEEEKAALVYLFIISTEESKKTSFGIFFSFAVFSLAHNEHIAFKGDCSFLNNACEYAETLIIGSGN